MGRINQEIAHLLELAQQLREQGKLVQKLVEPSTDFHNMEREMLINMLQEMQQKAQEQEQLKEYWQRKAQEQEQYKEDLQRQVIRLLDEIEAIASGNLTLQTEVTPDVIGAVADSVNQLVDNQIEILQQLPPEHPIRQKFQLPD
ncbi:MAG: hypothetical protein F6K41_44695, partial [Symploca sp. SIO3E6]|nr:hypothetical protein [Caldora sp. SIO3E6]